MSEMPIYLDYNATTPIDPRVAQAMAPYLYGSFGNPSSAHPYGIESRQAVEKARKGTAIVVVGVFGRKPVVDLGLVQDRELSLVGTLMYQKRDYERAIELVVGEKLCLDEMITHHFPFEEYLSAYETIEEAQGDIMKVMVTLTDC